MADKIVALGDNVPTLLSFDDNMHIAQEKGNRVVRCDEQLGGQRNCCIGNNAQLKSGQKTDFNAHYSQQRIIAPFVRRTNGSCVNSAL